jgi:hypothetical protein
MGIRAYIMVIRSDDTALINGIIFRFYNFLTLCNIFHYISQRIFPIFFFFASYSAVWQVVDCFTEEKAWTHASYVGALEMVNEEQLLIPVCTILI